MMGLIVANVHRCLMDRRKVGEPLKYGLAVGYGHLDAHVCALGFSFSMYKSTSSQSDQNDLGNSRRASHCKGRHESCLFGVVRSWE